MKRFFTVAIGLWIVLGLLACAQTGSVPAGPTQPSPVIDRILQRGQLVVGTAGNMPPLNMTTKAGAVIGFEPSLADALAKAMGVKLRLQTMPFPQLLPALSAGKVDMVISGMTITPRRNLTYLFAGPYFISGKSMLSRKRDLLSPEIADKLNDASIRLAVLSGSTSQTYVTERFPKARQVLVPDYDAAVAMVLADTVDGLIADHTACLIAELRHPNQGLFVLLAPLTYEPLGIALPGDDPRLLNLVDNFLDKIKNSGELEAIKRPWFKDDAWLGELP